MYDRYATNPIARAGPGQRAKLSNSVNPTEGSETTMLDELKGKCVLITDQAIDANGGQWRP